MVKPGSTPVRLPDQRVKRRTGPRVPARPKIHRVAGFHEPVAKTGDNAIHAAAETRGHRFVQWRHHGDAEPVGCLAPPHRPTGAGSGLAGA